MKRIRLIALIFLALFAFNLWSGLVYYVSTGGKGLGKFSSSLIKFAEFPKTIFKTFKDLEYLSMSQTFIPLDPDFIETNRLNYDVYTLFSYWNSENNLWSFDLINLKTDSILFSWHVGEELIHKTNYDRPFRDFRPLHTLIGENKSLIISFAHLNNLIKIDSTSSLTWINSKVGYHHSMEFDGKGDIWICAENQGEYTNPERAVLYSSKIRNLDRVDMSYKDDLLIKVNSQTGETLFKKSVTELLIENDYRGLLLNNLDHRSDPIHLNDIQPTLYKTEFWNEGDLFISLRNLSSVALYRPSTNKIIWLSQGPFLNQHDVDIITDKEISIFNNNMNWAWGSTYVEGSPIAPTYVLRNNEIVTYNFEKKEFNKPFIDEFVSEKINTRSEGLIHFLRNGDVFVEEQNNGKIYIFTKSEILLKKVFKTAIPGKIHMTNWMRIYESIPI